MRVSILKYDPIKKKKNVIILWHIKLNVTLNIHE